MMTNAALLLIVPFGVMVVGLTLDFLKACFSDLIYKIKKRKALKKKTNDAWIYKI